MRMESSIFAELMAVCQEPGFVHVAAYLSYRDFTVKIGEELQSDDLLHLFGRGRLIKTEFNTLLGMMIRSSIELDFPGPDRIQNMLDRTELLLAELHDVLGDSLRDLHNPTAKFAKNGQSWREPIFYGGESAYASQYRDFSKIRYRPDEKWLLTAIGFTVESAVRIIKNIHEIQNRKLQAWYVDIPNQDIDTVTALGCFTFTLDELINIDETDPAQIVAFLEKFTILGGANSNFSNISDYNELNSRPIIRISEQVYANFMIYSLYESLYESPFFWFLSDSAYLPVGEKNRGLFTESFSASRLISVFGKSHVYSNIDIYDGKTRVGEIDVLVEYAGRLLVVQAKSKKLTIAARKGNEKQLRSDFKAAIQDAYDQGFSCGEFLLDDKYDFINSDGSLFKPARKITKIHIYTVVAEHYPALTFQARDFLRFKTTNIITEPFTSDVFLLDVMCEILDSPLRFFDYMDRRARLYHRIMASHELTVLSYHMIQNLWVDDQTNLIQLSDDIAVDLEQVMLVRRDGIPGSPLLKDSMTKYHGTLWKAVIDSLSSKESIDGLAVGCALLALGGTAIEQFNKATEQLLLAYAKDGRHHDFVMGFKTDGGFGITMHCNNDEAEVAWSRLETLCMRRKYEQKAIRWCGVCVSASSGEIRFVQSYNYTWKFSKILDDQTRYLPPANRGGRIGTLRFDIPKRGRNDLCPCGSRKKYKKCCLGKNF